MSFVRLNNILLYLEYTLNLRTAYHIIMMAQGQYWAGRTPPKNCLPNMAAANFVMAEGCGLNGTAVAAVLIDQ